MRMALEIRWGMALPGPWLVAQLEMSYQHVSWLSASLSVLSSWSVVCEVCSVTVGE
jgi:hypothetical protein